MARVAESRKKLNQEDNHIRYLLPNTLSDGFEDKHEKRLTPEKTTILRKVGIKKNWIEPNI